MDRQPKQVAIVATGPFLPRHGNVRTADFNRLNRDFLLFMPNPDPTTTLRAVFTFYSDVLTLTSEGDSVVSGETLQGLGTNVESLLKTFLGSIVRLASPHAQSSTSSDPKINHVPSHLASHTAADYPTDASHPTSSNQNTMADASRQAAMRASKVTLGPAQAVSQSGTPQLAQLGVESSTVPQHKAGEIDHDGSQKGKNKKLIKIMPESGYFIAGAIAGGISRTATAPLDRLKVYLLVKTDTVPAAQKALDAAKKGEPVKAAKRAGGPLIRAVVDLYKSGGVRGFFAGA